MSIRKIIHIDMDAFYASVEQRDQPEIRGKPVIVGGRPEHRGVVCSASYEARKFGVRAAISTAQAMRLCPQGILVHPHFDKYVEASHLIRKIFKEVTDLVEPLSLDEAYLDVTENKLGFKMAVEAAHWIKDKIQKDVNLTASAGIGPNKFIAKLASDFRKPNGLVVVAPQKVFQFVEHLPVDKFWGVGPATAKKLHAAGIWTAEDMRKRSVGELETLLGSQGRFFFDLAHGNDSRIVDPTFDPKSRGSETTFRKDTLDIDFMMNCLKEQSEDLAADLRKIQCLAKSVTLKVKYSDFTSITRSQTWFVPTDQADVIYSSAAQLIQNKTQAGEVPIRLIGISVSHLVNADSPLQLWFEFPSAGHLYR